MADVDTVVIGSGAGGLAAAVALAQAGQRVLVLEQHYLPGGWCHSFPLGGYKFSPGVHYIGELEPGGQTRAIYEGLGLGADLSFYELNPDGFDHLLIAGERFDIPKGKERYAERLAARFPDERAGIRGYLDTVARLSGELASMMDAELASVRDVLRLPFRAPTVARWGLSTGASLINTHVRNPRLRAILAAQAGDHGLPPSLVSAPVHAAVTSHYFGGGYYPRGGGYTLPRAFIRALRRAGGEIRVRTGVSRILMERGRAIGVRLDDGTEVRARNVISNADPHVTFKRLIGEEHLSRTMRFRLSRTRYSTSALSLFFATDMDMRGAGLDSGNYWYYRTDDVDGAYRFGMTPWGREVRELPGMFLTVTTLKDPSKSYGGHHTMEAFTFVDHKAYARWVDTRCGDRPEAYSALKADLTKVMLDNLENIVPGLRDRVVFAELGTPLTNVHYVAATEGNLYGTEKSRGQVGPFGFQVGTEIPGLKLCGASTLSHGVLGATISGLVAAREILHCRIADLLRTGGPSITLLSSEPSAAAREPAASTNRARESVVGR